MDAKTSSHAVWMRCILVMAAFTVLACVIWRFRTDSLAEQSVPTVEPSSVPSQSPTPSVEPVPGDPTSTTSTPEAVAADKDAELREQLCGVWFHEENGEHWIENREDGTSRMLLKLDFVASLLYGKETAMELTWEVKDGILTHTVMSGSPQTNVDALVKAFGKSRAYDILETTTERMLLQTKDEKQKKDLWTRLPPPKEWADKPAPTPP